MKLTDLLTFAEKVSESVSEAVDRINTKLSSRIDGVESQIKGVSSQIEKFASADELDAVRAALNSSAETFSSEIEARVKSIQTDRLPASGVKSISIDGNVLVVEHADGDNQEIEIPVISGPPGASGLDGKDGLSGSDGSDGKDGKDGESGLDGKDGSPGEKGVDGKDGENGKDGADGRDGSDGKDGRDGVSIVGTKVIEGENKFAIIDSSGNEHVISLPEPIRPDSPRDPIDVKDALIGRENDLIFTFSDGTTKSLGRVVGRDGIDGANGRDGIDGKDGPEGPRGFPGDNGRDGIDGVNGLNGRDGIDGLGFDDMSVDLMEDQRTVNFMFARGETIKEFKIRFPVMIFRGGYNAEAIYEEGDTVQFGGSTYVATAETIGQAPGVDGNPWRLATSAGRSIRGAPGLPGADGRNGANGRDFRPLY